MYSYDNILIIYHIKYVTLCYYILYYEYDVYFIYFYLIITRFLVVR